VRSHAVELDPDHVDLYETLRNDWSTPDEWPIEDGVAMWRHARELASGFFSRWNPRPPDDWRDARRAWASLCREILSNNKRQLDTELQVRRAVEAGDYPHAARTLADWLAIEPTFKPNAEAVWISDRTIDWIAAWAAKQPSAPLIWTERPAIGERLAARHGLPYYGNMGVDASTGRVLESHAPASGPAVVSIEANATGRNLQAWHRNLIVDVPPNGAKWEQLLGRTHRDGQKAGAVHVDVLFGCVEDSQGFWRAVEDSEYAEDVTGQAQKLCHADLEDVEDLETTRERTGPQWVKVT